MKRVNIFVIALYKAIAIFVPIIIVRSIDLENIHNQS